MSYIAQQLSDNVSNGESNNDEPSRHAIERIQWKSNKNVWTSSEDNGKPPVIDLMVMCVELKCTGY